MGNRRAAAFLAATLLTAGCGPEANNLMGTWRHHTLGATVTLTFSRIEVQERLLVTKPEASETTTTSVYRVERRLGDTLTIRVEPSAGAAVSLDQPGPQIWTVRFVDADTVEITRPGVSGWQLTVAEYTRIL